MTLSKRLCLIASVLLGLGLPVHAVADSEVVTVDSHGLWTIAELGMPEIVLYGEDAGSEESMDFLLPADASQGPENWYLIHLDFAITTLADATGGFAVVTASTNGFTSAQIVVHLKDEVTTCMSLRMRWILSTAPLRSLCRAITLSWTFPTTSGLWG